MLRLLFVLSLLLAPGAAVARTILVVGDSLSAAYGIDVESGWVARLQQRLKENKLDYKVINASIGGDTTANGRARLPRALAQHQPAVVILELGGNDGLRGLPLEEMKRNLAAMIEASRAEGAQVVLVGIRLPPNYGPRYNQRFHQIYEELAAQYRLPLVPFLLEGVYEQDGLMQPDGIHPTAAAQARMLENVWPRLEPVLRRQTAGRIENRRRLEGRGASTRTVTGAAPRRRNPRGRKGSVKTKSPLAGSFYRSDAARSRVTATRTRTSAPSRSGSG